MAQPPELSIPPEHLPRAGVRLLVMLVGIALVWPWAVAQQVDKEREKEKEPKALVVALEQIDKELASRRVDSETLTAWVKLIESTKDAGVKCIPAAEENLKKLNAKIATLGEPSKVEPAEVVRQREELNEQKTALDNRIATCKVLILRSDELLPAIAELQKQLGAQRLLARGPTILTLVQDEELRPRLWLSRAWSYFQERSALVQLSAKQWGLLLFALGVAAAVGGVIRRQLTHWVQQHRWHRNLSSRLGRCLATSFAHYAPHMFFSVAAAGFFFLATHDMKPIPVANVFTYGLPVYFLLLILSHSLIAPFPPAEPFLPVPTGTGSALAAHLKVFAALIFLAYLLFATFLAQRLPESGLLLARAVFAVAFFVNLAWVLWSFVRIPALADTRWIQFGLALALVSALVAEFVGFRNLALATVQAVVGTLVALGIFGLIRQLLAELFDGLSAGRHGWHRRFRQLFALDPGDPVPGLIWVRLIASVFLWAMLLVVILRLWGVPDSYFGVLYSWLAKGFTIGSLQVNPARILLSLLTLSALLALSGWIRSRLRRSWLARTRMDRGAREATVTISGYVGVAVAALVALAVAGFEFTNLAIIAGALSVGIGFGLQAIVNNFVSGLILLFERPVKTGDWIVVGDTEGYVKRISIRSTLIQTFDRADVIVPNSDLITNKVTNWMLFDPRGRIRVPIGVAYGSDTEKVREVLLKVAYAHPEVVTDNTTPEPRVLFLDFGDSSLNFELRCYIQNIDMRRSVMSDLNFAIDKALREHGIEIPFPQRDVHIRDWTAMKTQTHPRASSSAKDEDPKEKN